MSDQDDVVQIEVGAASVSGRYGRPPNAHTTVVIAHGAGAGMEHPFLAGFARALQHEGIATLRFNFPYREAGRRFPDRPPTAVAAWRAAFAFAEGRAEGDPVWAAGKSFGGRMASMAAAEGMPVAGLVYLGYPLHPPGKPDARRDAHLYGITQPQLFVQGTNDPFSTGDLLDDVVRRIGPTATLRWINGGGHSFEVAGIKRAPAEIGSSLAPIVAAFIRDNPSPPRSHFADARAENPQNATEMGCRDGVPRGSEVNDVE